MSNNDLEKIKQQEYDRGRTAGVNLVWKQTREEIKDIIEQVELYRRLSEDLQDIISNIRQELDLSESVVENMKVQLSNFVYFGPKPEKTILIDNTQIRQIIWESLAQRWPDGGPTKVNCYQSEYLVPPISWLEDFWATLPIPPIYEYDKFDCDRMITSLMNRMNWAGNGQYPIGQLTVRLPGCVHDAMAITVGFNDDDTLVPVFGVWENNFYNEQYRPPKNKIFFELPSGIVVTGVNI